MTHATSGSAEIRDEHASADSSVASDVGNRRVPGARGQATRRRLLDLTLELLGRNGFRDLRVADIAREAGTSPATFYQYFDDIENALLALMGQVRADVDRELQAVVELHLAVRERDSAAASQHDDIADLARQLAGGFLRIWAKHGPLLRVVELQSGDDDGPLTDERKRLLNGVSASIEKLLLSSANAANAAEGPTDVEEAKATSFVLVAMLANVAAHQHGMISAGVSLEALTEAMAQQLAAALP